jgi:hypothetical protein
VPEVRRAIWEALSLEGWPASHPLHPPQTQGGGGLCAIACTA